MMADSDSDDEVEISLDDLAYLRQVERRSYLLKRSRKNHKVWHKRYCVLSDKLWVINVRSERPRAIRIDLNEPGKVDIVDDILGRGSLKGGEDKMYEFVLDNGLGGGAFHFRASSSKELSAWYDDLSHRTITSAEDSVIQMAELIMSEETRMRSERLKSSFHKALNSKVGNMVMDSAQMNIHMKNLEVLKDRKTAKEQLSRGDGTLYRSSISGKYAIYNGMSLPNDIERLEGLNSGEDRVGQGGRTVLRGMFRRRSGSNLTSERLFGNSMDTSQGGNGPGASSKSGGSVNKRVLSREASTGSLKALEGAATAAAGKGWGISGDDTEQPQNRRNIEFMCRYYQEAGADDEEDISDDDTTDEEDNGGSGGAGVAENKASPGDSEAPLSYIQACDVDMFHHLSRSKRRQSTGPHTSPGALVHRHHHQGEGETSREKQGQGQGQGQGQKMPQCKPEMYAAAQFHVALALLHAVHNFKEQRRRDAHMGPPSAQARQLQWQTVAGIFQEFLSPRLLVAEADMEVDDTRQVVAGLAPTATCFGISAPCVAKVAGAVTSAVEWCVSDFSGSTDQDDDKDPAQRREAEGVGARRAAGDQANPNQGGGHQEPQRSLSSSGQASSFWGAVFGTSQPAINASADSGTATEKRDSSGNGAGDRSTPVPRPKFFLPFPAVDVIAPTQTATLWAYLCTRKGAEVFHRQRVVACRVRQDTQAPSGDIFDLVVGEVEAGLSAV